MKKKFYFLLALMLGCVGLMCAQAYAAPQVGKIYYMKGKRSQKYLKASGTSLSLSAEKTTDCLFYVDTGNKIKAYQTSNYINCQGKNLSTTSYAGEFSAGTGGAYYYKNNGYYIYGGANTSATAIDRGTNANLEGYQWYFEEYTPPLADVRAVIGDGTTGGGGCGIYWIGLDIPSTDVNGNTVEQVPLYNIHLMSITGDKYNQSYMVVSNSSTLTAGSVVAVSQNNPAASGSAAYLCYNFNKEKLTPGRYYLFFVADRNVPATNRSHRIVLCSANKAYAPHLLNTLNAEKTNWHPNIKVNVASIQQAMSTFYGEKWVTIDFVRDAGYSWKISGTVAGATPSNLTNDSEIGTNRQWCFVGTPESFKIYSRAAGETLALTTNTASIGDGTHGCRIGMSLAGICQRSRLRNNSCGRKEHDLELPRR